MKIRASALRSTQRPARFLTDKKSTSTYAKRVPNFNGLSLGEAYRGPSEELYVPYPLAPAIDIEGSEEDLLLTHSPGDDLANSLIPKADQRGRFLFDGEIQAYDLLAGYVTADGKIVLQQTSQADVDHGHIVNEGFVVRFLDPESFCIDAMTLSTQLHYWEASRVLRTQRHHAALRPFVTKIIGSLGHEQERYLITDKSDGQIVGEKPKALF